jgi:precorrin-6B methylase 2
VAASGVTAEAPFVGTPHDVVVRMLELARVGRDDVVYDLGCGDGRIVVAAAATYGARAVGFELDLPRVEEARAAVARAGLGDLVSIVRRDVYEVDLRPATVLMLYLLPDMNRRLLPQIQHMAPGTRVVAHDYGLGDYPPEVVESMVSKVDGVEHTIMLWTLPLHAASPPGSVTP